MGQQPLLPRQPFTPPPEGPGVGTQHTLIAGQALDRLHPKTRIENALSKLLGITCPALSQMSRALSVIDKSLGITCPALSQMSRALSVMDKSLGITCQVLEAYTQALRITCKSLGECFPSVRDICRACRLISLRNYPVISPSASMPLPT